MKNNMKKAVLGIVAGFVNGLFGSGGGTILVPGMQNFLDVDTHSSHGTTIAIILPLSILSLVVYLGKSVPDLWITLYISIGGIVGGLVGAKILKKIKSKWLHRIFGFFMIAAAIRMIF